MPAPLICPVHREPLVSQGEDLRGVSHGEVYPVVDGVPVLIADRAERAATAARGRQAAEGSSEPDAQVSSAQAFYNRADEMEKYCRQDLEGVQADLNRWLGEVRCEGPVLEIGSGRGVVQGTGGDYVAVDYSLTNLIRYVRSSHQRVCASAEKLPFGDGSFRFLFTIATLEHVPGADLAFGEIDRVLKPGGVAYVAPAWHCTQYNCEGLLVRPYQGLTLRQKLIKATLPARRTAVAKAVGALPARLTRRAVWRLGRRAPTQMRFGRLRPDYDVYWFSDSDACSRLDAHEGCLYFESRGYELLHPRGGVLGRLMARNIPVIVRKPG
jgi:SAM-dependent methyltransferase/uncharacterized protein YbaR (Trm112 family)